MIDLWLSESCPWAKVDIELWSKTWIQTEFSAVTEYRKGEQSLLLQLPIV